MTLKIMLFLMILKATYQNMYDRDLKALKRAEGFSLIQTATHVRLIQILAMCMLM